MATYKELLDQEHSIKTLIEQASFDNIQLEENKRKLDVHQIELKERHEEILKQIKQYLGE